MTPVPTSGQAALPASAAIFDLDGVLVDTAPLHFAGWRRAASHLGFELAPEHEDRLKGVSRYEALNVVLGIGTVELPEAERRQIADEKNEWYVAQVRRLTPRSLLPGAIEVLARLHELGVPTALASSSRNAPLILRMTGLDAWFDYVVDVDTLTRSKPDPEIFEEASRLLNRSPSDCVVFEDAPAGVRGAAAAGCYVVGIGDPAALSEADFVVPSLPDVPIAQLFGALR